MTKRAHVKVNVLLNATPAASSLASSQTTASHSLESLEFCDGVVERWNTEQRACERAVAGVQKTLRNREVVKTEFVSRPNYFRD